MTTKKELHPAEISKLEAERESLLAEAASFRATAEHELAKARQAATMADVEEIQLAEAREKDAVRRAGDFHARVYRFTNAVGENSVEAAIARLSTWSRMEPECNMTIVFNSPGGSIISGMDLFDHIMDLRQAGHKITTVARGYSASMAGILLQAGTHRVIGKESWLLIHQPSLLTGGSIGEVEDTVSWIKEIEKRIVDIFYGRSNETDAPKKLSKAQIKRRMERKDWWLSSDQAMAHGFVDEVA